MNAEPRIALITGAGGGIGAATARVLAARGCRVGITYLERRDAAEADRVASPTFVELPPARPTGLGPCVIELDARGGRMRIEVSGVTVADLVALTQGAWGGER